MSIDLVRALDARATKSATTDSSTDGTGDFPNVLRSELADSRKSGGQADSPNDAKDSSSKATNAEVEGQTETSEAAVLAAAAAGLGLDQQAVRFGGDVRAGTDARLSDLEALELASQNREGASAGQYAGENSAGIVAGGELGEAEATALAAAVEGKETSADGRAASEAAQIGDVGVEALQAEVGRSSSEIEASRTSASDQFDQRESSQFGSEQSPQEDSNRRSASEQTLFDMAATGSQSEGVDPNLRDAITNRNAAEQAPSVVALEGAGLVANPVAGAVTETTTTGAQVPAAASDAISVQTEWLAGRGGGTARLLLSPPTLGEVAIQVTLRNGVVNVVIVAQEALAQAVAEDQADRLAKAFSNRDLRMDHFEVRRGDPQDLANGDLGEFADSNSRHSDGAEDEERFDRDGRRGVPNGDSRRTKDETSIQPQILSAGPEASVDLRI